ncbi:5-formyltetrahydrofolate cyclo-ligase [Parasphingopyxis algicola]|uniref:5-formyltetrahydrofolate cyclo-ligase n=1 Tax=Parasphingopyxis algicola TaxID=2026624 RepID=UPI0015A36E8A|nr:5-formyltetrahydrofolate cyclo-ligase [Parasphingopyxis algicola]QLC24400.1 5-formyltetrahydrofolate cyclo-ligase [Parasphingopyxis algicola]
MTKSELRSCFRKQRQDFVSKQDNSEIQQARRDLEERLSTSGFLAGTIGGYAAMTSEFDPSNLLRTCRENGHDIALPWFVSRDASMKFRQWDGTALERGPFGILQPESANPVLQPDTLLVPLVAVDRRGNRLGQGQGHYDRILAQFRADRPITAIGLAWECQIARDIPADPWDQPLDYIATPDRLIKVTS